jgi:FkbM family methyltransferase
MLLKEYGKAKARVLKLFGLEPEHNSNPATNGEYAFLRFARALPEASEFDSVIDVGANRGEWTSETMRIFDGTNISHFFCVEPIPTFSAQLQSRFASNANVRVMETALSSGPALQGRIFEISGGGRMYRNYRGAEGSTDDSVGNGAGANTGGKRVISHVVKMSTGDELFRDVRARPYLLKVDCDGHDGHVLYGFKSLIHQRRPLIQFEYCDFWIGARSRLGDACALLYGAGYSTYKLFPGRLVSFKYNRWFETYGYQNIVAAPKEHGSLAGRSIEFDGRRRTSPWR